MGGENEGKLTACCEGEPSDAPADDGDVDLLGVGAHCGGCERIEEGERSWMRNGGEVDNEVKSSVAARGVLLHGRRVDSKRGNSHASIKKRRHTLRSLECKCVRFDRGARC